MEEHQGNQGFKVIQCSTWEHGGFNHFTLSHFQPAITLTLSAHCTLQDKRVNKETAPSQTILLYKLFYFTSYSTLQTILLYILWSEATGRVVHSIIAHYGPRLQPRPRLFLAGLTILTEFLREKAESGILDSVGKSPTGF